MFGFGKKKEKPVAKAEKLSTGVVQSIYEVVGARGITVMPRAAQKAFQLSTDPNAEARDFIEVIESDEALSARVIKIANSVYFDRGHASKTIEDSVVVIGINELRCLLNATTLSEIFPSKHPYRAQLWANDVATGLISKHVANRISPQLGDSAFLAGLMHDIGKLLLLQRARDEYADLIDKVASSGKTFSEVELEQYPFDHTDVGQLIAERWKFGPELTAVISNHHSCAAEPVDANDSDVLTKIVYSADLIAHALGLGHPKQFTKFKNNSRERLDAAWKVLSVPKNEQRDFLNTCQKQFELEYDLYIGKDTS